ncbi:MAG: amidohydrolase family protein [Acidobacteriota bacterium]
MSPRSRRLVCRALAALLLAALFSPQAWAQADGGEVLALTGATVHPVSGPPLPGATVLVQGGLITALGTGVAVPRGARVVELEGRHLYPGFVQSISTLGLVEVSSVRGTRDINEIGESNSDLRAEVAFNADSFRLTPAMRGGVLTAHVHQLSGLFSGTTAIMRLDGWNWRDMTLEAPAGMVLVFPRVRQSSDDEEDENQGKELAALNDLMDRAAAYTKARDADSPGLGRNAKLEALAPVLDGTRRLYVLAFGRATLDAALDWIESQELENVVLVVNYEARYFAQRLADAGLPVILNSVLAQPSRSFEPYDAAYTAAAALHEAGVEMAINGNGDAFGSANARNLPFHAAMAAAHGLPKDVALESVTLAPARILGIADRVGSIEAGKEATFFVSDGDPLEIVTAIERVWIAGREVDLEDDHQYRLYQKYWNRPRPDAGE